MTHLSEMALEALASGRDDLVDAAERAHATECEHCRAMLEAERASVRDASLGLRRVQSEVPDLDAMIARAMAAAPPEGALAPTRRSLWIGATIGGFTACALAILALRGGASFAAIAALGRQGLTLTRAMDSLVGAGIPGGWPTVAAIALGLAALCAWPARAWVFGRSASTAVLLLGLAFGTTRAHAYEVDGAWPEPQPRITLDVERRPTSEALRMVADAAGLGLAAQLPSDPSVTLHVRDTPLADVVEALLGGTPVTVRPRRAMLIVRPTDPSDTAPTADVADTARIDAAPTGTGTNGTGTHGMGTNGTGTHGTGTHGTGANGMGANGAGPSGAPTLDIAPTTVPGPASANVPAGNGGDSGPRLASLEVPSVPPPPPVPSVGLGDRITFGDDIEIAAHEAVRSVYTMGGDARVLGRAYGDVVTMGGDAEIEGEVVGNVTTMGGDIHLGEAAFVHGDLNAMGGDVDVADGARVHGQLLSAGGRGDRHVDVAVDTDGGDEGSDVVRRALWHALLFLLGLVLLGTARDRFTTLREDLAAYPIRNGFGGVLATLAGGVLTLVLIVTLIGIPGAILLGGLLFAAGCVGWITVAWWLGGVLPIAVLKKRPVLQLGAGIVALFVVGLVPKVGGLLDALALLTGLGAVVATKFGRERRDRRRPPVATGPFR